MGRVCSEAAAQSCIVNLFNAWLAGSGMTSLMVLTDALLAVAARWNSALIVRTPEAE